MMFNLFIKKWAEFVVNQRWAVIIGTVLCVIAAIYPMKDLYYNNSNEMFLLPEDPSLKTFDKLLAEFGDRENFVIGVEARPGDENLFNAETLKMIAKLTVFLENHKVVTKVVSLSKYQYIHSKEDVLATDNLIEDIEQLDDSPENMERMANIMKNEKVVLGSLITEDLKHTLILARVFYVRGNSDNKVKLVKDFYDFVKQEKIEERGYNLHLFGNPLVEERFSTITKEDQSLINPLMGIVIMGLLYYFFRMLAGVFLPLMIIGASLVLVIGFMGLIHWPFNTVSSALPGILTIMGIGDSIHLIVEFYHFRNLGLDPKQAAIKTITVLWLPCFYTSLTTAIGFFSLSITQLVPIRELGFLGALGATLAFILSLSTLPAILSFIQHIPSSTKQVMTEGWVPRFTQRITNLTYNYRKHFSLISLFIFIVSFLFCTQISVDSNYINYFKKKTKMRQDIEYLDATYKSSGGIDLMVDSGQEGGIKEPELLMEIQRLQEYLETLDYAGKTSSLVNYLRKMNQSMHNDDPAFDVIPETRDLVAQYLLLYENTGPEEDLSDYKTTDERYLRIGFSAINQTASETHRMIRHIEAKIKKDFPKLKVEITGVTALFNAIDVFVAEGVVRSFGLALGIIALTFFFLFRSIKYGILALIPSILPIFCAGALMVLLNIDLDMGTMIVGALTMGIAVDDTIHVMSRYLQARRSGNNTKDSVYLAMTESGRAVIFTSIILTWGFSTMMLGTFTPYIYTGFFSAVIMLMALIGVLFLLPSVIFLVDLKNQNNSSLSKLS
ncbi:efflux RND transporter permease subunit [Deltaproteobacteria bacterium TL4]